MPVRITGLRGSRDQAHGVPGTGAAGARSHAEGSGKVGASAPDAHAEGAGNATGQGSHAEGYNTTASGAYSHAEGQSTVAAGSAAHAEGDTNNASGNYAHVEGTNNSAAGPVSHVEGAYNTANSSYSHAQGSYALANRFAGSAMAGHYFSGATAGQAQACTLVLLAETTDATPKVMAASTFGVTATGTNPNVLHITVSRAIGFRITLTARRTTTGNEAAMWTFDGILSRDGTAATPAVLTGPVTTKQGTASAAAWDAALSVNAADTANNYLALTVTGEAAKTVRWVARVESVEIG